MNITAWNFLWSQICQYSFNKHSNNKTSKNIFRHFQFRNLKHTTYSLTGFPQRTSFSKLKKNEYTILNKYTILSIDLYWRLCLCRFSSILGVRGEILLALKQCHSKTQHSFLQKHKYPPSVDSCFVDWWKEVLKKAYISSLTWYITIFHCSNIYNDMKL